MSLRPALMTGGTSAKLKDTATQSHEADVRASSLPEMEEAALSGHSKIN